MSYGRESSIANVANLKLAVVVLAFTTALNVILPIFITLPPAVPFTVESPREPRINFQESHPRDWDLPLKQVALTVEDTVNFQLDTFEGAEQWRAIQPPGDGFITLGEGSDTRRYRLAMFHALDCLDTVRKGVLQRKADRNTLTSPEVHLCLDYLRQTIQCRSDTQLEQVRSEYGPKSVQPFVTHNNCRDWPRVYAELEKR